MTKKKRGKNSNVQTLNVVLYHHFIVVLYQQIVCFSYIQKFGVRWTGSHWPKSQRTYGPMSINGGEETHSGTLKDIMKAAGTVGSFLLCVKSFGPGSLTVLLLMQRWLQSYIKLDYHKLWRYKKTEGKGLLRVDLEIMTRKSNRNSKM